jgi:acetoin utilization protein AcuB
MPRKDPTVGDYMSRVPHSIGVDQSLADAAHRMHQLAVRHLPVLDGGNLVGILSDRDVALVESLDGVDAKQVTVEEAMTAEPYTVDRDTPLRDAATVMSEKRIGTAIVMNGDRLDGVLTTTDALRALAELLAPPA